MNSNKFIAMSNIYVANINRVLKSIKSDTMADFIWADQRGLTITTNKVTSMLDLNIIDRYIKNVDVVDLEDVIALWLSQSKSYFKILGILYIRKNNNTSVSLDFVKQIL